MKKNERVNKNIKGEKDRIQHKAQQNPESMVDKYPARDTDQSLLMETPFYSRMDEHAATLSRIPFAVQRQEYIMRLNNTYGNRYVQRLMKSVDGQARRQDELEEEELLQAKLDMQRQEVPEEEEELLQAKRDVQMMPNRQRQDIPEEEEVVSGARMKPIRENVVQQRSGSGRSASSNHRASPSSSATGEIGDAVDLDGQGLYGWNRVTYDTDVATVVNGVIPTESSEEEMPRIVIFTGTHGTDPGGHLLNDEESREFVGEDQATASAVMAANPGVEIDVIDVVNSYGTKGELTSIYGMTDYIRILGWCFSQRSYGLGSSIKSNWWPEPDNL
jgi:hypothetical protein